MQSDLEIEVITPFTLLRAKVTLGHHQVVSIQSNLNSQARHRCRLNFDKEE